MRSIRIELRWAILFSFFLMAWMWIEKYLGWHDQLIGKQVWYHLLILLISYIVFYYFALKDKRNIYYKGKMDWKRALISGGIMSVFIAILSPFIQYFIYNYITPDYFGNMIEYQTSKEKYSMTLEGAQSLYNMKTFIFDEVVSSLSFGIVISAIVGLFVRTKESSEK